MTHSTHVDISPGKSLERTRPFTVEPFISEAQWLEFCTGVDDIWSQLQGKHTCGSSVFLGGVILGFVLIGVGGFLSVSQFSFSPLLVVGFVIFVASMFGGGYIMSAATQEWVHALKALATETSQKLQRVSVHVQQGVRTWRNSDGDKRSHHQFCFEFLTPDTADVEAVPVQVTPVAPIAQAKSEPEYDPSNTTPSQPNVKDRLKELEGIKDMLTEAEYTRKRQEILDSI